ncbi:type VI secretion system tip protein VgrG [Pannus brasiliensis CCIBt3594]|uniref:Type VI secretion system tip protein VgrG n=1 Tax=Pannus brasiliensis CCIBt3594 TaxID=1427578 RepID=A0AAW9QRD6_9CHRO
MPETRTLPISAEHREFTVKVNGEAIGREYQLLSVSVIKSVNKIAGARLVYLDGTAAAGGFPLSNSDRLIPGQKIEILAGALNDPVSLFKGMIIRQEVKTRQNSASQLIVECRHAAFKLTVGRENAYFFDRSDSQIIEEIFKKAGIEAEVDKTNVIHPHQVQYNSTAWDFLLSRAEVNGKIILTDDDRVKVKTPNFTGNPVCTLQYGSTILEMDAEIDARCQYNGVKSVTWDAGRQSVVEKEAKDPDLDAPGNLSGKNLAKVTDLPFYRLQHPALGEEEAQAWADARWLQSKMGKVNGRIKCEGIATVNPGDLVKLSGVGDRYNGNVFVTGVRHEANLVGGWKTHIQFGTGNQWLSAERDITAPPAAALLPGINGLQIGIVVSNEDPDGEHRVRVKMPLVNEGEEGTWARVASVDAGNGRGFFFRPEIGDEVVLGFFNDDPRQAVILGMLHSSAKAPPLTGSDKNHRKGYQSRSKMQFFFDDEKKTIRLETPAGNKLNLNEEKKELRLEDQNGNKIVMNSDGIQIQSNKAIVLKVATSVTFESSDSITIKAGNQLTLTGNAGAELSSTAITNVKGSLVQIN